MVKNSRKVAVWIHEKSLKKPELYEIYSLVFRIFKHPLLYHCEKLKYTFFS